MYSPSHRDYRWVNKPLLFTLVFLLVLILFLTFSRTFAPTWVLGAEQQPASGEISPPPLTIGAMTVGLSFGLKDIFANFVSGIIILFERPIRIGDVVTVGGSSGRVTRIRIRSTTVTDWDRRELIVPNKAFLTEKIINWSLSDQMSRVVIDIGIGYGSDPAEAQELLLQIAKDSPLVLKEPAPSVVFEGFGADSLDFKLRVFVTYSNRVKVATLLRHEIFKVFNKAGIEIPFAQRDVHLDTSGGPLEVRMAKGEDG
jgi:potassium efflux system protein